MTLPLVGLGLVASWLKWIPVHRSRIGSDRRHRGYLCCGSVFWAFKLVTGKEGMGYGDFKLLAASVHFSAGRRCRW
jgi:prepilin signal peptidase PulO-like enzyme (type II secretory pathway)